MASINNMYPKKYYYDLGEFVAKTMLDGIIHPDLQLSNIGCNDGNFVFLDFADIEELAIPEDLSEVTLKQLTQSLFSVIRDFMGSLESLTYFHAGFVSYSGLLGQCLFFNMANHGFSICGYLGNSHIAFHMIHRLSTNIERIKISSRNGKIAHLKK